MSLFARLFRLIWGADVDRALRPVLAVNLASSMGGSTVWSFVGIWAIRHLHASQSAVGVVFLVSALAGVLAGYAGGHLSDHVGRRPLILVSWAGQVALVLGFLAAGGSETAGLGLMCLGGVVFQIGSAASQAMIADLVPRERHEQGYAAVRVAQNLGVTLGPPTGGLFLALGSWSALFVGAAALFFGGFVLALRYLPRHGDYAPEEPPTRHSFGVIVRDRPFLLFLASSALAWLVYVSFEVVEMLWVPTSQTIVAGLAPADVRGAYMGAFGSMAAIGFALAPFLGLQIRAAYGDAAVWAGVAGLSVVAAAIGAVVCRIAVTRGAQPASAA